MVRPCVARGLLRVGGYAVLHQCIRPLIGAFELRAIMDISAPAISLADRPQWAIRVTSIRKCREDRSSAIRAVSRTYRLIGRPSPNQSPHRLAVSGALCCPE